MEKKPFEPLHVQYWHDFGAVSDGPRYNNCLYTDADESRLYVPGYPPPGSGVPEQLVCLDAGNSNPPPAANWVKLATDSDLLPYKPDHGLLLLPICPELPVEALCLLDIDYRDIETVSPVGRYRFAYLDSGAASLALFRLNVFFYMMACAQLAAEQPRMPNELAGGWRSLRRVLGTEYVLFPHAHLLNAHLVGRSSEQTTADVYRLCAWRILYGKGVSPDDDAARLILRKFDIDALVLFCREVEDHLNSPYRDPLAIAAEVACACREVPSKRHELWFDHCRTMREILAEAR
jgi:hypothetical protein